MAEVARAFELADWVFAMINSPLDDTLWTDGCEHLFDLLQFSRTDHGLGEMSCLDEDVDLGELLAVLVRHGRGNCPQIETLLQAMVGFMGHFYDDTHENRMGTLIYYGDAPALASAVSTLLASRSPGVRTEALSLTSRLADVARFRNAFRREANLVAALVARLLEPCTRAVDDACSVLSRLAAKDPARLAALIDADALKFLLIELRAAVRFAAQTPDLREPRFVLLHELLRSPRARGVHWAEFASTIPKYLALGSPVDPRMDHALVLRSMRLAREWGAPSDAARDFRSLARIARLSWSSECRVYASVMLHMLFRDSPAAFRTMERFAAVETVFLEIEEPKAADFLAPILSNCLDHGFVPSKGLRPRAEALPQSSPVRLLVKRL